MAKKRVNSSTKNSSLTVLTEVEWTIMDVVWRDQPCAAGTVQEALSASHRWAYSTVKTTMDRMVTKGLLATHAIRNLNLFTAKISRDEARRSELRRILRRAFDGALAPMIQFLLEQDDLSEQEIEEMRTLIRNSVQKK